MIGNIFDIKKFAVHDGPGIRSTVFLKGCPLKCIWCQNPEGIVNKINLWYFENRCINCYQCIDACPTHALSAKDNRIIIDREKCNNNGNCVDICPTNALHFDGRSISVNEIVKILVEDKAFYKSSNGGITLSGGDPMFQHNFSLAILKACKKEQLHTAIETSMFAKEEVFKEFIDFVDYFIVDLKLLDSDDHVKYIGQPNELILSNFKLLASTKKDILVRIPLIPGITTTKDNISGIASFVHSVNPKLQIELINYNPFATNKYRLMGLPYSLSEAKPLSNQELDVLYKLIEDENISVRRETLIDN
jgi:pyruvate formate lyase activating enzyme